MYDVVIVGGGPAGLSAGLILGRCRRRILLCDGGRPRNAAARELHGYLTRDGTPPLELLRLGRAELGAYGIEQREVSVTDVAGQAGAFEVSLQTGERVLSRTILLATGVRDHLPDLPGIRECYGVSVHHCPYCDGWEVRDKALAVVGDGSPAAGLALSLTTWSSRVMICTNGRSRLRGRQRQQLGAHGIEVQEERIAGLDHDQGHVRGILMQHAAAVPCDAVFFSGRQRQQCTLAEALGCEFTRRGTVRTDHLGQTCVAGVYVVGDASRDVQFVIVAAAEGAKAGVAINKALQAEAGLAVVAAADAQS